MPKGIYNRAPRATKEYAAEMVESVARLYHQGMTQAEIATAIGTTQKVIWRLMKHHGIVARPSCPRSPARGPDNGNWKGDDAGYDAMHIRLYALYGAPMKCSVCGTADPAHSYDWANLTGNYADPSDFSRMCRACHRKYDNKRRGGAPGTRHDVTPEVVGALRSQGLSINEIARRLNTSWPTVRKHLPK